MNTFIYIATLCILLCLALATEQDEFDLQEQFLDLDEFYEDLDNYFAWDEERVPLEKRRRRRNHGPCRTPTGLKCRLCNYKITNPRDMRRYLICPKGRKV